MTYEDALEFCVRTMANVRFEHIGSTPVVTVGIPRGNIIVTAHTFIGAVQSVQTQLDLYNLKHRA